VLGFSHGAALTEAPRSARHALVRLKSAIDFERVRRDGRSHAHPLVVLIARRRAAAEAQPGGAVLADHVTRAGVVAGKSVGTAVDRNRAKRLLREALRRRAEHLAAGWDLVLIARRPLAASKLVETQAALEQLLRRARLLVPEP
jgi:ribonuclease P protein component